jgi:predicted Zn-dependent protease with MMP-like domain
MTDTNLTAEMAWTALEKSEPELAMQIAIELGPEDLDAALVLVHAALDLGDVELASTSLVRAHGLSDGDDAQLDLATGDLALATWDFDLARSSFERILTAGDDPGTFDRLALALEHLGETEAADGFRTRAHELEPEGFPPIVRVSEKAFDDVIEVTLAGLPEETRQALDNVRIVREPLPDIELVPGDDPLSTPPDLIGIFIGASRLEQADAGPEHPSVIHLFQRNIERIARDERDALEQVRITLLHEVGHFLGLDEDGVTELGLG